MNQRARARILLYSHDSYGLGHLRRSLSIAAAIVHAHQGASVLLVSGSPTPDVFELPPRCEIVKLPSITKDAKGDYVSRGLAVSPRDVFSIRSEIITTAVRTFRPDILLVDHTATGPGGELLPVLRRLRHDGMRARVLLGFRDIIDSPHRVRAQMARDGTVDVLESYYDDILVYGDSCILDVSEAYWLSSAARDKTTYVGIVCPPARSMLASHTAPVAEGEKRILVTAGGGEDGYDLLRGVIAAMRGPLRDDPARVTFVAGPLMSPEDVWALKSARQGDPRLRVLEQSRNMTSLVASADLVVSMGGYNSVYEALSLGRRLLIMPRVHPRQEQLERATRLADLGAVSMLSREDALDPTIMSEAIRDSLAGPEPQTDEVGLRFDGADATARHVLACISERVEVHSAKSTGQN